MYERIGYQPVAPLEVMETLENDEHHFSDWLIKGPAASLLTFLDHYSNRSQLTMY
jgi:hypothetical protein